MSKKIALITGIFGQDGYYLTELLIDKEYIIYGMSKNIPNNYDDIYNHKLISILIGDITDKESITKIIDKIINNHNDIVKLEIYNLAAISNIGLSFSNPIETAKVNALGPLLLLEVIREKKMENISYIFQAATSEMYDQTLDNHFNPKSPYAVSKLFSYHIMKTYRDTYNMYISTAILFNHESSRRNLDFVSKKITHTIAKIYYNKCDKLYIGNLDAMRDWGYAKDFCMAIWLTLQKSEPNDYTICTGEFYSVRDFITLAFKYIDINIVWKGNGLNEKGYDSKTDKILVEINPKFFRSNDSKRIKGKYSSNLGWEPSIKFSELVKLLMEISLDELK